MKRIMDLFLGFAIGLGVIAYASEIPFKTTTVTEVNIDPEYITFKLTSAQSATLTWPGDSRTISGQAGKVVTVNATIRAKAE